MIAKIQQSHPGMKGTLDYNERKVASGKAERIGTVNVGNDEREIRDLFSLYEKRNIRTEKVSFQMSLNPNPENPGEALSDDKAMELAVRLMTKLGYGGQPIAVYRHNDIDREHFHIVSIRVTENGRMLKQKSRLEKKVLMKELNRLAKEYGYTVGDEKKVKAERKSAGKTAERRPDGPAPQFEENSQNVARQMREILDEALTYRFTTFQQLSLIMEHHGVLLTRTTAGEKDSIVMQGLDRDGNRCTQPITQDEYGEDLMLMCMKAAGRNIDNPHVLSKAEREKLMRELTDALERSTSEDDLKRKLRRKGISIRLSRTKSNGQVFGLTVVDHRTKTAYKGSEISRDLNAALFRSHEQRWAAGGTKSAAMSAAAGAPKETAPGTVKERGQEAALAAGGNRTEEGYDSRPSADGHASADGIPAGMEETEGMEQEENVMGDFLSDMIRDRSGKAAGQTAGVPNRKKKRRKGRPLTG